MSSPHVVVACHAWYADSIGGSFRLASELAESLAANDCRVSYLCAGPADRDLPDREEVGEVVVYRYRPPDGSRLQRLRGHLRESVRLLARIHDDRPVNILTGHSPLQFHGAAKQARRLPDRAGLRTNFTVHSPFDDEITPVGGRIPLTTRLAIAIARRIDRACCRLADVVQTDSQYTLDVFRQRHRAAMLRDDGSFKGVVAPGWVDTATFRPADELAASKAELRASLGSPWPGRGDDAGPVFFTLRRLEPRMGLEDLVDAAATLKRDGRQFRVLIGGGGSLRESLDERIAAAGLTDTVVMLGRIPEDSLAASYAAADCFVLPTRALECFGLIVLEAFAAEVPVIAAAAAAIPELAEHQGRDWLFPPGNADALADRMRRFLDGTLRPTQPLREFATGYDRETVLERWRSLLLAPREHSRPVADAATASA